MITKKRLEELIKQGATIWSDTLWYTGKIYLTNNDTDEYQILKDIDNNYVYLNHHKKGTDHCYDGDWCLEDLREDVDRAEWEYKMTAERTERFEPPMWDDFNHYEFQFINYENGNARKIIFEVLKKQDNKAKTGGYISILNTTLLKDIYKVDTPTKENYKKACEIVRDLFKWESNGKNS